MTNKIVASALRTNGYYLDAAANTLYMTAPFEKKSNVYGTSEYRLVNEILAQFPDVKFSIQKKNRKETVTYEMMETYIKLLPKAEESMKEYERVKLMSHAFRSSYKYVADWFEKKYQNYGKFIVKDNQGNVVWDIVALYKQAEIQKASLTQEQKPEPESFLEEAAS